MYMQNPAKNAEVVVTGTNFSYPSAGIYVGVGGDVVALMSGGASVTFVGVASGSLLPIRATQIVTSGTTATDMLALFN